MIFLTNENGIRHWSKKNHKNMLTTLVLFITLSSHITSTRYFSMNDSPNPQNRSPLISYIVIGLTLASSALAVGLSLHAINSTTVQVSDVRNILVNNPDILMEATKSLQAKMEQDDRNDSKKLVSSVEKDLFEGENIPFFGNPKGTHVVVEFFDYQCEYCRSAEPELEKELKKDPELKILKREIVIINERSVPASLLAIASIRQGKYKEVYDKLIHLNGQFTDDALISAVSSIPGLNIDQLKTDMTSKEVTDALKANVALARAIKVTATPSFVSPTYGVLKGFGDQARFENFVSGK